MSSFITSIPRPVAPFVAAAAVLAALALPSAAAATPSATLAVSVVENHLSIDSLSSTTPMRVQVIRTDENTIRVTDPGGTAQTGDHCLTVQDDDTVDCDITGLTVDNVQFQGSPQGDTLAFEPGWSLPVIAYGWGGHDVLAGADGNDLLYGGDGNDTLKGGQGNDEMSGGNGADRLNGGTGSDVLRGGHGSDRLFAKGDRNGYTDNVYGGPGSDRATLDRRVDTSNQVERRTY